MAKATPPKVKSEWAKIRNSKIHHKGMFATKDIPKETYIIEYVGEKISKKESDKRYEQTFAKNQEKAKKWGSVYIYTLNSRYDLDGNVPYNTAKYINHSCSPNAQAVDDGGRIFIESLRTIKKGEEITYNYGYDVDSYEDHICKCGSKNCVGYIVAQNQWKKLQRLLAKK